jgi:type III restriction enzyme
MTPVKNPFSLADITDRSAFRDLGQRISSDPEAQLRRTTISARVVEGPDGLRRTELVTAPAVDKVDAHTPSLPLEDLEERLTQHVLSAPVVPARANQREAAEPLISAFLEGLGDNAQALLSAYFDRAAAGLIAVLAEEERRFASKPSYEEVVELAEFGPVRHGKREVSTDRVGTFKRGMAYEYGKSLYTQDWFDSSTERTVANALDEASEVLFWVRLQRNDLSILWAAGRDYNPDFIVVEESGTHWVVEVKMQKEVASEDVQAKRHAAQRWANHCSADPRVAVRWRYLLLAEKDVETAKGSWSAMKRMGS